VYYSTQWFIFNFLCSIAGVWFSPYEPFFQFYVMQVISIKEELVFQFSLMLTV